MKIESVKQQILSHSSDETFAQGRKLGELLEVPTIVCFFGELAAGKTTFIKGLIHAAAQIASSEVQSPTFNYLNIYEGRKTIYHFDLYRLRDRDEFLSMGFDEFFDAGGICCIEWSERIEPLLPAHRITVTLEHVERDSRQITIVS